MLRILHLVLILALPVAAQTSEDNDRLREALKRFPDADADKDGILTLEEAMAYREKRLAQMNRGKKASAPKGGERHVYKTIGDLELPLYVYKPAGHKEGARKPAIVFFFGGGWSSGNPAQFEHQCKYLAERGMVAITVDYRVSSRHQVKIKDCIEDAKSAMRWVRAHAGKLGIDPDRIAAGGGSAGGHLAAATELVEKINSDGDDLKVSAKPNAMVLFNPAISIAPDPRMTNGEQERLTTLAKRAGAPLKDISPLTHASQKQPPCIMFFGTEDPLLKGARFFREDSTKAGNTCQIVTYKGQGHGFFNHGRKKGKYYQLTLAEMDRFFVELGWLTKTGS